MLPLVSHVANLFNLCPLPDGRFICIIHVQNWFPIRPAVWPQFPSLLNCWFHKTTHNTALGYRGANWLSLCPFPDESTDVYQIWCQSVQPFDSFPRLLNVWPPKLPPPPKCPLVSLMAICLAYIHSQMNLHMCTKCDANRTSRLTSSPDFWICDHLTPPPPNVEGRIVWAYVHSQMNPQTCTKFGANRSSRLTASPDFWMCDPPNPPPPTCPLGYWRMTCI